MKSVLTAAVAALALTSGAALAERDWGKHTIDNGEHEVGFGLGLTWSFGASAKPGVALGVKAFSQRKQDSFAASVGVDYLFLENSFRPNLGLAYLGHDSFIDVNYGYSFSSASWGLGFGAGYAHTVKDEVIMIEPR